MGPTTKKKNAVDHVKTKKLEKALREGREDAKEEFESQRAAIYDELSTTYKDMFGQIIFAKWKKSYIPALVLSPYSVPPGLVRTMWMDKFEKLKAKNMLDQMIYLIYWYGSKNDGDFYGFVSKSNFTTYKQEVVKGDKGIHKLPAKLKEKMNDKSVKLTPLEDDTIRAYKEVEEDLLKDPSDRKRGVVSFLEGYEMLSYDDLDEIDVDESSSDTNDDDDDDDSKSDDDEDELVEDEKPKAIVKKSHKNMKIAKTVLENIDSKPDKKKKHDLENETQESLKAGKTITKSKPVKKRSRIDIGTEDSLLTASAEKKKKPKKETTNTDNKKTVPPVPSRPMIDSAAVLSDGIGENDEDDEDVDDGKSADGESAELEYDDRADDDDDKDDHDFVENVVVPNQSKKIKKKDSLKKVTVIKKEQKVKTKIDLPKTDKQLKRRETEEFRHCEEHYLLFLRKWEKAIKAENVVLLRRVMVEADLIVGNFCSSFMISYGLNTMMKHTKQVLKNANEDLTEFNALKEKLRTTFEAKRLLVPKGYVIPKRSYPPSSVPESKQSNNDSNMDASDHGEAKTKSIPDPIQSMESIKSLSQSNTSSSTMKGIPQKGLGVRHTTTVARPDNLISSSTVPKFKSLLGNIMQQQRLTSSQSSSNIRDETKTAALANNLEQVPSWATASVMKSEIFPPIPQDNEARLLALEFLIQMAQQFPDGLVNVDTMARSLESAIYKWAQSNRDVGGNDDTSWISSYWRKVHAVVAAFCGSKLEKGTFHTLLLQGKFDTPNKIVNASDDKYDAAFEGRAVTV